MDARGLQKALLFAASFLLTVISVLPHIVSEVGDFETSIYSGLPFMFWVAAVGMLGATILSIFLSIETGKSLGSSSCLLVCGYGIILTLPKLRGYLLFGRSNADILVHLGYTKSILETGFMDASDPYPSMHVLMAIFEFVGVDYWSLRVVLALTFTPLLLVGLMVYSRRLANRRRVGILVLCAAAVPLFQKFHVTVQPAVMSWFLVPLILLSVEVYRTKRDRKLIYVIVLFVLSLVFSHPLSAFMISVLLAVYATGPSLIRFVHGLAPMVQTSPGRHLSIWWAIFVAVIASIWTVYNATIQVVLGSGLAQLIQIRARNTRTQSILAKKSSAVGSRGLTEAQTIIRGIELYGPLIVYVGIAGLFAACVLFRLYRRKARWEEVFTITQFGVGGLVAVPFLVGPLFVGNLIRVNRYTILFGIISVGLALDLVYKPFNTWKVDSKTIATVSLIGMILVTLPIATFGIYKPNYHLTAAENSGVDWTLQHHDESERIYSLSIGQKHAAALLGMDDLSRRGLIFHYRWGTSRPDLFPRHLGYPSHTTVGDSFGDGYLVTKTHDTRYYRWFYDNQRSSLTYYTEGDLRRLHRDSHSSKVYANGGYSLWELT
jgi:hypothetical protein